MDARYLPLIAEEAAEVAQAAMKALRFGLLDSHPSYYGGRTNAEALAQEVGDLLAVIRAAGLDERQIEMGASEKVARLKVYGPDGSYLKTAKSRRLRKKDQN